MTLFPSTRTDYVLFNEHFKPFQDVHVRRAISYLIDRKALVKAILFGNGTPANSFLPPQVPYYDAESPGLQYNVAKAKEELAKSSVPKGFTTTFEAVAGSLDQATIAQVMQAAAKPLGIKVNIIKKDANAGNADWSKAEYPGMNNSYWTMDIADPDELVSFSIDPSQGAHSFQTFYNNPAAIAATKAAAREFDPKKRQALYSKVQKHRRAGRVHGVPLLLAVPLRLHEQGAGLPGLSDRQLPHGGRLAAEVARRSERAGTSWIVSPTRCAGWRSSCRSRSA